MAQERSQSTIHIEPGPPARFLHQYGDVSLSEMFVITLKIPGDGIQINYIFGKPTAWFLHERILLISPPPQFANIE